MLSTNANFDAVHDLDHKKPLYLLEFDGETTDYSSGPVSGVVVTTTVTAWLDTSDSFWANTGDTFWVNDTSTAGALKQYIKDIKGHGQTVTPEEGKSSIGSIVVQMLDYNDELTALWATDTDAYFHRRKTTIKAGYQGVDESDFATIMTAGRVTGMKLSADGLLWILDITDPRKYEQERIFLDSEDTTLTIQGNPIDILLSIFMSSDTPGTNHAFYDRYGAGNGLNLTTDDIDVDGLEDLRDNWFPGNSHYMKFTITERETAGDFITSQIRKVLNLRPALTADGKMTEKPFKPPLATSADVQSFDETNIVGLPKYDANLSAMVNRVEFFRNYDGSDYLSDEYYVDATSLLNRGPGKKPIVIKSRGLHSDLSPGSMNNFTTDVEKSRKTSILARFKTPPTKITINTWFTRWLSEAGDIVPFTHSKTPDIVAGTRGLSDTSMEIIDRQINWKDGKVTITLLDTGFAQGTYGVISDLSVDYDDATAAQKKFGFIAGASNLIATGSCTDPDNDADNTTGWNAFHDAVLSSEAGGNTGYCLKVLEDGTAAPFAYSTEVSIPAGTYRFGVEINSDGSEATYSFGLRTTTAPARYLFYTTNEAENNWLTKENHVIVLTETLSVRLDCYSGSAMGSGTYTLFDNVFLEPMSPGELGAAKDPAHLIVP